MAKTLYPYYYTIADDEHRTVRCATHEFVDFKNKKELRGLAQKIAKHLHSCLSKEHDFDIEAFPTQFRVYDKQNGDVEAEFQVEAEVTTSFEIIL